ESRSWRRLAAVVSEPGEDECRVLLDPAGRLRAYLWRGTGCWYVTKFEREHPHALVLGEVMSADPAAADAALAACQSWAAEETARRPEPVTEVLLALPPEGPVAAAAMHHAARFTQHYQACGGSMARTLDAGRLLQALRPELARRLQAARASFTGSLHLQTGVG